MSTEAPSCSHSEQAIEGVSLSFDGFVDCFEAQDLLPGNLWARVIVALGREVSLAALSNSVMSTLGRNRESVSGQIPAGGFALVEMLVVIAVIGNLPALLTPALNRAKAIAWQPGLPSPLEGSRNPAHPFHTHGCN